MPYSFELTPEQEELKKMARDFARENIAPVAADIDEKDEMPYDLWKKMGREPYRFTGIFIPKEYDGKPRGITGTCIINEELAGVGKSPIAVMLIEAVGLGTGPVMMAGSEAQKKKLLSPIARGEEVCSFGLTEPGAGSDTANIETRAEKVKGGYILNGRKRYASFTSIASYTAVFAKTDPAKGSRGISVFVVDRGTPGIKVVEKVPCIGMRGHQDEEVLLENCFVPETNRLGEEGKGIHYGLATLDDTRTTLCAGYVGLARAAYEEAVSYAKSRHTFGKPLLEYQAISFPLAEVAIEIEAARFLIFRAAWMADRGVKHTVETAMAKSFASSLLLKSTNLAVEVHGGFGCTQRFPVERMFRDGRIWVFAQGAPNIQKLIVSRDVFK